MACHLLPFYPLLTLCWASLWESLTWYNTQKKCPPSMHFSSQPHHKRPQPSFDIKASFLFPSLLFPIFWYLSNYCETSNIHKHHNHFPFLYFPSEAFDDLWMKVIFARASSHQWDFYHTILTPISPLCDICFYCIKKTLCRLPVRLPSAECLVCFS